MSATPGIAKVRITGSPHGFVLHRKVLRIGVDHIALASAVDPAQEMRFALDGAAIGRPLSFVARIHPADIDALKVRK